MSTTSSCTCSACNRCPMMGTWHRCSRHWLDPSGHPDLPRSRTKRGRRGEAGGLIWGVTLRPGVGPGSGRNAYCWYGKRSEVVADAKTQVARRAPVQDALVVGVWCGGRPMDRIGGSGHRFVEDVVDHHVETQLLRRPHR